MTSDVRRGFDRIRIPSYLVVLDLELQVHGALNFAYRARERVHVTNAQTSICSWISDILFPAECQTVRRRAFLSLVGIQSALLSGCLSPSESAATPSPSPTTARTATQVVEKPGTVDNHRITAVEPITHEAVRRSTNDGHKWVVTVTLRLKPQDPEIVTVYPIGVFFIFFDTEGEKIYRVYQTVPANTGTTSRTVDLSAEFRPSEAVADTFHRYRIDLVHA